MQNGHGGDIYSRPYELDFSANINPLGCPESVVRAACEGVKLSANYPDVQCGALRTAIARADGIPAEMVICGNGAAELIFSLCLAVRPENALLIAPGFSEYEQALRAAGSRVEYYTCTEDHSFQIGDDLPDRITPQVGMVFLCNPNNPTGVLLDRSLLETVLQKCIRTGTLLVVDECFIGLLDDGPQRTMVSALEQAGNLFILRAFTKLYAMAGLRLGYGLCSDLSLLEKMHAVMQPWNVSIPAQMAGVAALKETDFPEKSRRLIREERNFLETELPRMMGLKCFPASANFIFFRGPEGLARACARRGILIRDCSNYVGLEEGYYRIAVRTHAENVRLLEVLREALSDMSECKAL